MTAETRGAMEVRIGGLVLANPVLTASGTYGYGCDVQSVPALARLGAVITKGLSLRPREGNPPPRIWETGCGMLNSIGLANMGVDRFIGKVLPVLRAGKITVIANIFGESEEEFEEIAALLGRQPGVAALEVNVSCPNVRSGGVLFGRDPAVVGRITTRVVRAAPLPAIVKLTPSAPDLVAVALAAQEAGAAAVTALNTYTGMAIDTETGLPRLATVTGGYSGPAVKPMVLRWVYELARALSIPVVASGGVMRAADAVELMMAGAAAVQVGTASFVDPAAPFAVLAGIEQHCARKRTTPRDLTGLTLRLLKNKSGPA